ncbi:MAG: ABC transporter ATP-binding protein, partial [Planctomycetes bacterium]|nr:ABC transporter ATP-binding protein [Planctomycetota bacterium]
FLGPNGAGKSTTMKMITGFLSPDAGRVTVSGYDVSKNPIAVKARIGYLPEGAPLYPDMTPDTLLHFSGRARGMGKKALDTAVDRAINLLELQKVRFQRIETLSKGFKRRVGLAQAILHDPEVLVLDEPTDGLDPNQKEQVRNLIRSMAPGKTIILSTHILEEVEAVCTRVAILSNGALCFNGSPADLRKSSRFAGAVEIRFQAEIPSEAFLQLSNLPGVALVEPLDEDEAHRGFRIFPESGQTILHAVSDKARDRSWSLEDMHVDRGRLDDVFRTITLGHGTPVQKEEI